MDGWMNKSIKKKSPGQVVGHMNVNYRRDLNGGRVCIIVFHSLINYSFSKHLLIPFTWYQVLILIQWEYKIKKAVSLPLINS